MHYSELYAKRIRILCKQRGLSINKLAEMSGLKESTIDNIMQGKSRNPQTNTIHKTANALNMTLAEFLDFEDLNAYSFDASESTQDVEK